MNQSQGPYKLYTPAVHEPLPLRHKPFILPAPPEANEKPQKINWLQTLLPPFIMLIVLSLVASVMQMRGFIVYSVVLMGVYPAARVIAYLVQKHLYDKAEAERAEKYSADLEAAEREIVENIRRQKDFLKKEFLPTASICKVAEAQGKIRSLWQRTKNSVDFMALRLGIHTGKPSFSIEVPKGEEIDAKDALLLKAKEIKKKYQTLDHIPYLLPMRDLGSLAILGEEGFRYGLARRLALDVLVHHRPDEVAVYVLSNHPRAADLWGWLRWAPHSRVFHDQSLLEDTGKGPDDSRERRHLIFGTPAVKIFLGRLESSIGKDDHAEHQFFIIDVDGIQQYDDQFVEALIAKAHEWNLSLLFVGGSRTPRSVRAVLKPRDARTGLFVDTRVEAKDKDEKEYHTQVDLDELPDAAACEQVTRCLAGVRLLSSSGDELLSSNVNLFKVLGLAKEHKLTFNDVLHNWTSDGQHLRTFDEKELLQFPIGLVERNSTLSPYTLNLLEARFGGLDAYHTMLIGTTGSGKSELIKSLILGAAYKYPPQYLNFFCMDFKGGSTVEQLEKLPHVIGAMTNLDEVLAQRGLIAINYEIDRRQAEFQNAAKQRGSQVKDIWDFNEGRPIEKRMPHLVLVLDEFTRGLDMLNSPEFSLQDLLEKRLVPQGRSLGIYLILANQVVNAKVMKLLPNVGWRIAMRVASPEQLQFIDSSLKPPRHVGRGYIQALGEDPVEFQSGYSGDYVQYTDIQIRPTNIQIRELLPDGSARLLKSTKKTERDGDAHSAFLEMNQLISSVELAHAKAGSAAPPKMYLPPLPGLIELHKLNFEQCRYREFTENGWGRPEDNRLLQAPIGKVDLVNECRQATLSLDFLQENANLLIAGSQGDIIAGLRSVLFPLLFSHSPEDVQVYMLEFGKGLNDLPCYPHIGSIVTEQESERVARTINFFDRTFSEREQLFRSEDKSPARISPDLFLVINNIAGLVDNLNLYKKVFRFITQESFRCGIHLILTALPRSTGTRVSSNDLKTIKSRIVFPSIHHEDYWYYFDVAERKLARLTDHELNSPNARTVSRAHWICAKEQSSEEPVELQLAAPVYHGQSDEELVRQMNKAGGCRPAPIRILERRYEAPPPDGMNISRRQLALGIQWGNLQEFRISLDGLPSIWGVSGARGSGRTNFLTLLMEQFSLFSGEYTIETFSVNGGSLVEYCQARQQIVQAGPDSIIKRLQEIEAKGFGSKAAKTLLVFDDLNSFWERETETSKEIRTRLENLANLLYGSKDAMLIASFSYTAQVKAARAREALIRELHDNKTGFCLGFEGEWILSGTELLNYRKNVNGAVPAGRGVFVLQGQETEMQAYCVARQ